MNATKTDVRRCSCNWAELAAMSNRRLPISYDAKMGEYLLELIPDGSAVMRFCPFCGGELPDSKRDSFFADPTPEDMADITSVIALLKTVNDMHQHLGVPDETIPADPSNPRAVNQYSYCKRWASVTLCIQETREGSLAISYIPKLLTT